MATPGLTISVNECRYELTGGESCPDASLRTAGEWCAFATSFIIPLKYNSGNCGDDQAEGCEFTPGFGCFWVGGAGMSYYQCGTNYNPCQPPNCVPEDSRIGTPYSTQFCDEVGNFCGRYAEANVQVQSNLVDSINCIYRVYPIATVQPIGLSCGCSGCSFNSTPFAGYATDGAQDGNGWYREFQAYTCVAYAQQLVDACRGRYTQQDPNQATGWIYSVGVF